MSSEKLHAVLSPSGASRWMACTPSARLELQFEDRAGEAAQEGTLAHRLGELLIKIEIPDRASGMHIVMDSFDMLEEIDAIKADPLFKPEMLGYMEDYAAFVIERYNAALTHTKDAILDQEVSLPLAHLTGEDGAEGTGDNVITADGTMEIIDLKYGKGVRVEAQENKQMMLYALGALKIYSEWYKIHTVRMTIYQPRIDNVSTWEISVEKLKQWADTVLKHRAALALAGKGVFITGEHCQFCKAKAVCKANHDYQLEIAKTEFADPVLVTDEELVEVLKRKKAFESWLKAVSEHALRAAIIDGKKWPGLKLVEGRSVRKYTDTEALAKDLNAHGFPNDVIFKRELYGVTALQGILTKKVFDVRVTPYLIKPPGKAALVPLEDKRPELNSVEAAQADFADDLDEE